MNILDYVAKHPGQSTASIARAMSAHGSVSLWDVRDELYSLAQDGLIFSVPGTSADFWYIKPAGRLA